jgi:di/tricarboxylate transporter
MTFAQIIALTVLVGVVAALIWGKLRSDVVALAGAAVLLATRTVRPVEVQGAFASPAIIALASLFVIAYAMELSGLLGLIIRQATRLCARLGAPGLWVVISACGAASAFLNNTPIVVLAAPVVREMAGSLKLSPQRFLIPLSYATILGGSCTLIGTSTNLLVNDMARNAGQRAFSMFEITPVGLSIAVAGWARLILRNRPRNLTRRHTLWLATIPALFRRTGPYAKRQPWFHRPFLLAWCWWPHWDMRRSRRLLFRALCCWCCCGSSTSKTPTKDCAPIFCC